MEFDDFENLKPAYDALPEDKKNTFKVIFEDGDVMSNKNALYMWFHENYDDKEFLAETKGKVEAFIAEN